MEVLVRRVHQEVLDYRVNEDPMVTLEDLEILGRREELETRVPKDQKVLMEDLDPQVVLGKEESRVRQVNED